MRDNIFKIITKDNNYQTICRNLAGGNKIYPDLWKDLYQAVMVELCLHDCTRLTQLNDQGKLRYFVWGIAKNLYSSKNSTFYRQYNHFHDDKIEAVYHEHYNQVISAPDEGQTETIKKIETKLNRIYWFNRFVFQAVLKEGSITNLAKKTKIQRPYLSKIYNETKKQIQNEIKKG